MSLEQILPTLFDNYFIKVILLLHALVTFLTGISLHDVGIINIYLGYNTVLINCILLAIVVDRNADIVLVGTLVNAIAMVLDLLLLLSNSGYGFWSVLLLIVNLLLRPFSIILMLKNYSARAGITDPTSGLLEVHVPVASQARTTYHNIDQPSQTLP